MYFNSNVNKTGQPEIVEEWFVNNIFNKERPFLEKVHSIFTYQFQQNLVYKNWCEVTNAYSFDRNILHRYPFLPISFYKTHKVFCGNFIPEIVFKSSGTSGESTSTHFVKDLNIYRKSFREGFKNLYGDIQSWCIIALLPSYLERDNSSLVFMIKELIEESGHKQSGFYLYDHQKLANALNELESQHQKSMMIGVTFALLDFSEKFSIPLQYTHIMETGGMKGRRKEITRQEVHTLLSERFNINSIHAEYGMTELLSQAYALKNGRFKCPHWMQVLVRDEDDPLHVSTVGRGALNIIDLANIYSCSFIATDDIGIVYEDGTFEVLGRMDNSDVRGCSLLTV